jgi:hypothetical protein
MKTINMIDVKVEAKINITFGTTNGETFKFFFTTVDKKIAEKFIPKLKEYLGSEGYDVGELDALAQVEILGPVCPQCEQRFHGLDCSCGYHVKSEVISNLIEAANGNRG